MKIPPASQRPQARKGTLARSPRFAAPNDRLHGTTNELSTLFSRLGNHTVQRLLANELQPPHGSLLQRKLEASTAHAPSPVQRKPAGDGLPAPQVGIEGGEISSELEQRIQRAAKHGKQVPPSIRRSVENTTGADLNHVRYHDDKQAHAISSALGAKAATYQDHIFLGAGESPYDTQLMAHELTHTVQQGAPQVQRLFGKKKLPTTNKEMFDSGTAPQSAFFTVTAAVKMNTTTRGTGSLKTLLAGGPGHSWLEIRLGPAFPSFKALMDDQEGSLIGNAMEDSTKHELTSRGRSTIGFYPEVGQQACSRSTLAKQIVSDLPGHLLEPEQATFDGSERGGQTFPVTDVEQAKSFLRYIRSRRSHSYNVYRYNCTDFVADAIKKIGYSMGKVSHSLGITLPTLLYKQIYTRSELGDRSATYSRLHNNLMAPGKRYDAEHLSKKAQKKLNKRKAKVAPMLQQRAKEELWARVIHEDTLPGFLNIREKGMLRPGTKIGITGVVTAADMGEIVVGGNVEYVYLKDFQNAFGYPYPRKDESSSQDKRADQSQSVADDQSMKDDPFAHQSPHLHTPDIASEGEQFSEEEILKDVVDELSDMDIEDAVEQEAEISDL
jgi:hypothetical protein